PAGTSRRRSHASTRGIGTATAPASPPGPRGRAATARPARPPARGPKPHRGFRPSWPPAGAKPDRSSENLTLLGESHAVRDRSRGLSSRLVTKRKFWGWGVEGEGPTRPQQEKVAGTVAG